MDKEDPIAENEKTEEDGLKESEEVKPSDQSVIPTQEIETVS